MNNIQSNTPCNYNMPTSETLSVELSQNTFEKCKSANLILCPESR